MTVRTRTAGLVVAMVAMVGMTLGLTAVSARQSQVSVLTASPFESYLESLRAQAGIPGMSAALVQNGEIVWERGFGFQNQESRIRATPDTPYPIADISQTIASVLVLQCAEQRRLRIDDSLRQHGGAVEESSATLRQVMSHASGAPAGRFRYDPERYSQLTQVVESCTPQPYRKSVAVSVLERLAMKDSVPGRDLAERTALTEPLFASEVLERYHQVLERIAIPYKVDKRGRSTRTEITVEGINAAGGLVTTVRDFARFDAALDEAVLLSEETLGVAWSNATGAEQATLPTGLGWFVQRYKEEPVVWHFGLIANGYSSLVVKLPSRHLTFILFANSDGLSAPFQLDSGDVTRSIFATLFLRLFT
jgi:CubicO group peptidase (beta-lactamase class C family)